MNIFNLVSSSGGGFILVTFDPPLDGSIITSRKNGFSNSFS